MASDCKIIPRIFGGLGNQLFIYAAARRLALVNACELVLDDVSGFVRDYVYQRHYQLDHFHISCRKAIAAERLEPLSRLRRNLLRRLNGARPFAERRYIQQEGIDFDPRLLALQPNRTCYLEGYWQSEGYFKDVERQIREDLQIIPPTDQLNQRMGERITMTLAVAVHVRFFDESALVDAGEYQASGTVNNAPADYYHRAISEMEQRVSGAHYFIFSDQPQAARARIPLSDERLTLVSHNQGDRMAYADLWLMSQCKHFIIANSTFSWWGAWLAEYAGKQVISPGRVSGTKTAWGFSGLLPREWTIMEKNK